MQITLNHVGGGESFFAFDTDEKMKETIEQLKSAHPDWSSFVIIIARPA